MDWAGQLVNATMDGLKRQLESDYGCTGRENDKWAAKYWESQYFTRDLFFVDGHEQTRAEAYAVWVQQGYNFAVCNEHWARLQPQKVGEGKIKPVDPAFAEAEMRQLMESLSQQKALLVGDVMVAASFLAYIGPFNEVFRAQLLTDTWLPDLLGRDLPITEGVDPLGMLTDEATVAAWKTERLPADRLSLENGAIISNCTRFPLIIDPQLQGVTWVKQHEAPNGLVALQLSQRGYLDRVYDKLLDDLELIDDLDLRRNLPVLDQCDAALVIGNFGD